MLAEKLKREHWAVIFDRGSYKYHGRVAVADVLRESDQV